MPAQLTPETQAKLAGALSDKDAAEQSDAAYQTLASGLVEAQKAEADAKTASLAAHQRALDSAHDALAAVGKDLGLAEVQARFARRPERLAAGVRKPRVAAG